MRLKLNVAVIPKTDGDLVILADKRFAIRNASSKVRALVFALREGITAEGLNAARGDSSVSRLITFFQNRGLLSPVEDHDVSLADQKTMCYLHAVVDDAKKAWRSIVNMRIGVVGCGGIGSVVAQELVAMGFKKLTLVDGDVIDASNLNRQTVFTKDDIGKDKVQILAQRLQLLRDDLEVTPKKRWIKSFTEANAVLSGDIDFLVCAADKPCFQIRPILVEALVNLEMAGIFAGVGIASGSFGPLLTHQRSRKMYLERLNQQLKNIITDELHIIEGSLCASNHLLASLLAWDIFHFAIKDFANVKSLNTLCTLHFSNMTITTEKIGDGP